MATRVDDVLQEASSCRRAGSDRRHQHWRALWIGSIRPRRIAPRRRTERGLASVDWHHPQWLAVAILILVLCAGDAFMTLTLISLGAEEVNPIMRPLVLGSGPAFALWKMGLTSLGVVTLVLLARLRAFGWLPIGAVLYAVLGGYILLIIYEFWLLDRVLQQGF
ncbi:MAG: DUF5658 family protein [Steroidobacteraceae bacterium]